MPFGDFSALCGSSPLPLCSLLGPLSPFTTPPTPLLPPSCSARSIEVANTIIFQAATDFAHIVALGMTAIMILHVRSKFTAVGRKEILTFFYIYLALTVVSLVLDAGVLPARSGGAFPWFVSAQSGLASALCTCLLVNGFVGFQLYEDGTTLSVWLLRLSSLGMFVISFAVSLFTFKSWAGLSPTNTIGLFVVLYIINAIGVFIYLIMQVILVTNTLQDRWPLGDLAFGVFFFIIGQVILYTFGSRICEGASHYLDGLFFATICNLLAVMMVYKYWDSITREDLEFSVGAKQGNWEVKQQHYSQPQLLGGQQQQDPLVPLLSDSMDDSRRGSVYDGLPMSRGSTLYESSGVVTDYPPASAPHRYSHSHSRGHSRGPSRDRSDQHVTPYGTGNVNSNLLDQSADGHHTAMANNTNRGRYRIHKDRDGGRDKERDRDRDRDRDRERERERNNDRDRNRDRERDRDRDRDRNRVPDRARERQTDRERERGKERSDH